jgi:oligopeptidase A
VDHRCIIRTIIETIFFDPKRSSAAARQIDHCASSAKTGKITLCKSSMISKAKLIFIILSSCCLLYSFMLSRSSLYHLAKQFASTGSKKSSTFTSGARRSIPLAMVATTDASAATDATLAEGYNPYMDREYLPKFTKMEPDYLTPAVDTLLEDMTAKFKTLEEKLAGEAKEVDYDQVLPEVEKIQFPMGYAWGVAGHLNGVKNSKELREAYEGSQAKVVKAFSEFSQSKPLYDALEVVDKKLKTADAGSEDEFMLQQKKRAVESSLRAMKLGGVGLEGEAKERFNEIKIRLSEISTKYSNNVLDSTKAYGLTVTDPAQLEGVPSSAKGMWSQMFVQHAKAEAEKEGSESAEEATSTAEDGPWRITLDGPSYIAACQHIPDRSIREKIYRGFLTRASDLEEGAEGTRNNVPLIEEILQLKYESSKLLGYDTPALKSLEAKMAPSVESISDLSDLIAEKALPAARKELDEVTAYARENGGVAYSEETLEKLMPWDVTFWSERYKEAKFSLKEEELRPYFPFDKVSQGMFDLVNRLFGITVKKAPEGEVEVWHPDVSFYHIYDDTDDNKHIASFYLDPYSRPADKRGGAWMADCLGKSEALANDIPVAYLTCNGSPPVGDTPSLMTFREVETLFHEFGHGLQHMLTRATVGDVAGISGIEWDAVELPSQFMENWCYDKPTVYGFAKHYETGEPLPEAWFDILKKQKTYNAGMTATRQLYFGQMDMELHHNFDPSSDGKESIFDVQKRIAAKYSPHNMPLDEDRFLCAFSHIFAGGYSAGYYSYKWAEVMSADAFGAFEDVGLDNEESVKEVGKKFRDTVLSLGGGVPPSDVFKLFRGRDPSPDALLRHDGLA